MGIYWGFRFYYSFIVVDLHQYILNNMMGFLVHFKDLLIPDNKS